MAVSSSDGSGGATLSNYQHWVKIGSVTYSCYEGSLNSAQIAANVAAQINASDPNCTATVGGQYNNEILITLKAGVAGPIAVSSSDGSAAASLTQGTRCRHHPEQHRQPDQRNELGAERPRRAQRRRGVAEPVGRSRPRRVPTATWSRSTRPTTTAAAGCTSPRPTGTCPAALRTTSRGTYTSISRRSAGATWTRSGGPSRPRSRTARRTSPLSGRWWSPTGP